MIIVICRDDPKIIAAANSASQRNSAVFGGVYIIFEDQIPTLGINEDLFIIAHGAKDDSAAKEPVIGDENGNSPIWVSANDLVANLKTVIPKNYTGNVYLSACEVIVDGTAEVSFAQLLLRPLRNLAGRDVTVYGDNDPAGALPPPADARWTLIKK